MADVTVDLRVSVEDLDRIEEIAEKIKEIVRVADLRYEEVGFGIKMIRAKILVDDKVEGFDSIEEKINNIDGVSGITVISMDRDSF